MRYFTTVKNAKLFISDHLPLVTPSLGQTPDANAKRERSLDLTVMTKGERERDGLHLSTITIPQSNSIQYVNQNQAIYDKM